MTLFTLLQGERWEIYLLIFLRIMSAIVAIPLFGYQVVPVAVKAAIGFVLTLAVIPPALPLGPISPPPGALPLISLGVKEVLIGVAIGLVGGLFFAGAEMAGRVVGVQSGIGVATTIDPLTEQESDPIAQLKYLLALVLFLTLDMHHQVLLALKSSLEIIPPGEAYLSEPLLPFYLRLVVSTIATGVRVAAPVVGVLFVGEVALGFVARAIPQMNVFFVSIPLKIGVSLMILIAALPLTAQLLGAHFQTISQGLFKVIGMLGGR